MRFQSGGRGGDRDGEMAGRVGHQWNKDWDVNIRADSLVEPGEAEMHDGYHESDS